MSPAKVHASAMRERLVWVADMVHAISRFPLDDEAAFFGTPDLSVGAFWASVAQQYGRSWLRVVAVAFSTRV